LLLSDSDNKPTPQAEQILRENVALSMTEN
jgi:hypothetical protein